MSMVRIGPKHQVTIPKHIFDKLHLETGDFLEAVAQDGKIIMIPKGFTAKAPAPSLTKEEEEILLCAKEKISRIQTDLLNSQGLNDEEIEIAVRLKLIDPEQTWWWKEEWQKGEREAEKEIAQESTMTFRNTDELTEYLFGK